MFAGEQGDIITPPPKKNNECSYDISNSLPLEVVESKLSKFYTQVQF